MKKSAIMSCVVLVVISFFAFNYVSNNNQDLNDTETASLKIEKTIEDAKKNKKAAPEFIYDVGTRFSPIKKERLSNNLSITHFLDEMQRDRITSVEAIEIIVIENDKQTERRIKSIGSEFNTAQIHLLKSFNYSEGFKLRIDYKEKHFGSEDLFDAYSTPHHTIVPETQAEYIYGKKALINYLKEHTIEATANIPEDKLKPAKLYFTITKDGSINSIYLDRTSGYPEVDALMMQLINNTPGGWIPAVNAKGENVDQELVVSFGLMGC
jgi:hypothetical protein